MLSAKYLPNLGIKVILRYAKWWAKRNTVEYQTPCLDKLGHGWMNEPCPKIAQRNMTMFHEYR